MEQPSEAAPRKSSCPPEVLQAIYGKVQDKQGAYDESLRRWWSIYAERKMEDETEEYVANSLLYDKYHAPRTAKAPDCVKDPTALPHKHHHHHHAHKPEQQPEAAPAGAEEPAA